MAPEDNIQRAIQAGQYEAQVMQKLSPNQEKHLAN
ncbi:hypothetical protein VTH82DRAFT_2335 [Thermothelomyces myriococcoides]